MAKMITMMTRRDIRRNELRERIQELKYHPGDSLRKHIRKLDCLVKHLEEQAFPVLDNYKIWALDRSLPLYFSGVLRSIWDRFEERISYRDLVSHLLHHVDMLSRRDSDEEADIIKNEEPPPLVELQVEDVLELTKKPKYGYLIFGLSVVIVGVSLAYYLY